MLCLFSYHWSVVENFKCSYFVAFIEYSHTLSWKAAYDAQIMLIMIIIIIIIIIIIFSESDLEFLKGAESFKALTAKIYLITNGLGGRQVPRTLIRIV
jgi:hypothetical protein